MNMLHTETLFPVFMPHQYCLRMIPWLVHTMLVSHILIALSYTAIPLALFKFGVKFADKNPRFNLLIWQFIAFIELCGIGHAFSAWNLFHGDYVPEVVVNALTAIVSVTTAITLFVQGPELLLSLIATNLFTSGGTDADNTVNPANTGNHKNIDCSRTASDSNPATVDSHSSVFSRRSRRRNRSK